FELPDETTWTFREDVDELAGARDADRPAVEVWPAIWRGLRDRPIAPHVKRTLAKIEGSLQLRDLASIDRLGLAPDERAVCERLFARPSTLPLLTSSSKLAADRTELLVYLLALSRSVVRVDEEPVGPAGLGAHGVRDRARRIDDEDPKTVRGRHGAVSIEAARAAYFRLARLWHPDRIPEALSEVRSECEHVFLKLGEAHRILTDTSARGRAAKAVDGLTAASPRDERADGPTCERSASGPGSGRITLRDVDAALARNDLEAADTFAHALSSAGTDGPTARAVIAWCGCSAGMSASRESLEAALAALDRIITGDPECVRALYYRALLAARLGRTDAALRDHRKVVRLDPRHVEAHRELRLHEMRHRPGAGGLRSVQGAADRTAANSNGAASASVSDEAGAPDGASPDGAVSGLRRLLGRVVGK
ncbi:MAG TPA: hypothetical protein VLT33_05990, partial [Labilithrix sp.]|nr:hypothetical protein [Labilithrix sp.]